VARKISPEQVKAMAGDYKAPAVCVCPKDNREYPNPSGLPCEARVCDDGKTRMVKKTF